jgi:hypothetical protein
MSLTEYQGGQAPAVRRSGAHITERDIALIERQAGILAKSSIVALSNPADIALIALRAMSLGIEPMAAFDDLYPIRSGDTTRISISARMRVALARRAGCTVEFTETTDQQATCRLRRPGERTWHTLTYTIAQAATAGLTTKDNWKKHPAPMLRAAAARQLVNMAAQDILLGIDGMVGIDLDTDVDDLDLPEEIVEHTDVIDVDPVTPAAEADVTRLFETIEQLDDTQRAWLKGRVVAAGLPPVRRLEAHHVAEYDLLIEAAREIEPEDDGRPFDQAQLVHDEEKR